MDVEVRDAVEADAETLGAIVDLPADVLRNVVHDRTVRLAVQPYHDPGPNADVDAAQPDATVEAGALDAEVGDEAADTDADDASDDVSTGEAVHGFVAFDVEDGTVHVTQLAGEASVAERLLAEPVRFAINEGFDVALVVPESEDEIVSAVDAAGFESVGPGPRFEGEPTTKYRFSPD